MSAMATSSPGAGLGALAAAGTWISSYFLKVLRVVPARKAVKVEAVQLVGSTIVNMCVLTSVTLHQTVCA